jgi:tyrosyl-tRNA synthetase
VLTTPLLVGLDGVQKMSKSLGNYVGIAEPPAEQFGKLMSISDAQMPAYFQYATAWAPEAVAAVTDRLASGELHPNAAKRLLARTVVDLYHGDGSGSAAEAEFDRVFKHHDVPDDVPDVTVAQAEPQRLSQWLVAAGLATSNREAVRAVEAGSVKIDGAPAPENREFAASELHGKVIQVGRRKWARIHPQVDTDPTV